MNTRLRFNALSQRINLRSVLLCFCFVMMQTNAVFGQEDKRNISSGILKELYRQPNTADYITDIIVRSIKIQRTSPDSAIILLQESLKRSRHLYYLEGITRSLLGLGVCYFNKNDFTQSALYYQQASPYCSLAPPGSNYSVTLYNGLAGIAYVRGNHDSAVYWLFQALEKLNTAKVQDTALLVRLYANLGGFLSETTGYTGKSEQALYYLNKAIPLARQINDTLLLAQAYMNAALVYANEDSIPAAQQYLKEALWFYLVKPDSSAAQLTYYHLGRMLVDQDEPKKALAYFDKAVNIYPSGFGKNSPLQQAFAVCYFQLGNYEKSIFYYKKAIEICAEQGLTGDLLIIHYNIAKVYSKMLQGQLAYEHQKAYADIRDSLVGHEKIRVVNQMEVQYRTSEKDRNLLLQQLQLSRKDNKIKDKNLWIGGIIFSALFIFTILIIRYRNKQKLQREQLLILYHKQEIEQLNARMQGEDLERSRIARELHDGVSVLLSAAKMNYTAIGKENTSLAQTDTYREVMDLLNQTGQEVRSISYNLVPELLISQSLPAAVQAFCELIQKGHHLQIELQSYGSFAATDTDFNYTVYRMVQELIHNIVKHAQATEVLLQLTLHQQVLQLTVEDNGIGFEEAGSPVGMGLQNIRNRVKTMHGQLRFTSGTGKGTTVEIEIPLTSPLQ